MPYVTSVERHGIEKGKIEGKIEGLLIAIELHLDHKFGHAGSALMPLIRRINDTQRLKELQKAILTAATVEEIGKLLT